MRTTIWTARRVRALGAVAVAGLVFGVAACGSDSNGGSGGGDVSADEQPYVDAIVQSIKADETAPFSDEQATCLAAGMVNIIGVEEFEKAGITPDSIGASSDPVLSDLSASKADELVTLVFDGDCFDFGDLMAAQLTQDTSLPLDQDKAACLGDAMAKSEGFRKAFVAAITGDDSTDPFSEIDIFKMFSDCGVSLGDVTGTTG